MTPTYNETQDRPHRAHHSRVRRTAIAAAKIAGVIFGLAALVHVSWNMFAPDMFELEAIRMKQALGLVVFTGVLSAVLAGIFRFGASRKHDVSGEA